MILNMVKCSFISVEKSIDWEETKALLVIAAGFNHHHRHSGISGLARAL